MTSTVDDGVTGSAGLRLPRWVPLLVVLAVVALPWVLTRCAVRSDANFADREQFVGNRLGAGSVEVSVVEAIDTDGAVSVLGAGPSAASDPRVFSADNMAPGDSVTGALAIGNSGSLPVRYWVTASVGPPSSPLADWLLYDVWRAERCRDGVGSADEVFGRNLVLGGDEVPILGRPEDDGVALRLEPGQSAVVCLGARLPLAAPNEIQSARLDIELMVVAQHSPQPAGDSATTGRGAGAGPADRSGTDAGGVDAPRRELEVEQ